MPKLPEPSLSTSMSAFADNILDTILSNESTMDDATTVCPTQASELYQKLERIL